MSPAKSHNNKVLISCGILKDEIIYLIKKNNWKVNTRFLDSSLHVDFNKLWKSLSGSINKFKGSDVAICYGACHPLMERLVQESQSVRTPAQNCIDMVLGTERFTEELEKGAFFLFEDWAVHWEKVSEPVFGKDPCQIKELFQSEHKYFLCMRTPCSNDFSSYAERVSQITGLPLKWIDVKLNHLENHLQLVIE